MSGQEGDVQVIDEVILFWFGKTSFSRYDVFPSQYKLWYGGGKEIDDTIRNRFGSNVERALAGQLDYWVGTDTQGLKGALALTIILDQFPRSIYRGKSKAYAGDVQTRDIVQSLLQPEKWEEVKRLFPPTVCISFMLPLMHQESVEDLNTCYSEVEKMAKELEQEGEQGTKSLETLRQTLTFTVQHRDIVTKFGRYPYRNEALQRESSAEELQFLNDGPRFGQ